MRRIHEGLANLDLPLLAVWGMRDRVFVRSSSTSGESCSPQRSRSLLEDAGHFRVEDRPAAVADAIAKFPASL